MKSMIPYYFRDSHSQNLREEGCNHKKALNSSKEIHTVMRLMTGSQGISEQEESEEAAGSSNR
jgi:hypothetical protein